MNRSLAMWTWVGQRKIVARLRGTGLKLIDTRRARRVHKVWDTRSENGQYWEMYAWAVGPVVIPLSPPRRNSLMEMTTPAVLSMWERLDIAPRRRPSRWLWEDAARRSTTTSNQK